MSAQQQSVKSLDDEKGVLVDQPNFPGGPLKKRTYPHRTNSDNNYDLHLAYCPVCGPEVSFEGQKKPSRHIATHDPEDFGLAPLGCFPRQRAQYEVGLGVSQAIRFLFGGER
jgi:hypothetical protein